MKLVASMIVRNELGRYLEPCVEHLLEFVDQVVALDDYSTDGTFEWLDRHTRVNVRRSVGRQMFENEGAARQSLLDWTLQAEPTHVLSIDADEFVADGAAVRRAALPRTRMPGVWTLTMQEVWEADEELLCVRQDGGWRQHETPVLWQVPYGTLGPEWRIADRQLASGREPSAVVNVARRGLAAPTGTELLHFGWANEDERLARFERYRVADGGRFHSNTHLQSILWPCERVALTGREWPAGLQTRRDAILARSSPGTDSAPPDAAEGASVAVSAPERPPGVRRDR